MARIPEYSRRNLVSSFVGEPVRQHEGAVAGAFGEGMAKISQQVNQQLEATAKQQAATATYQYQKNYNRNLAGTAEERGLADEMVSDPLELPQKAVEMGEKLMSEMATGLSKRAQTGFQDNVQGFLAGEQQRLSRLAIAQNRANQVVAMQQNLQMLSDEAVSVTDETGVSQLVRGLRETAFSVDDGLGAVGPKHRYQEFNKHVVQAARNFAASKVHNDPTRFAAELKNGQYRTVDIDGEKVPFMSNADADRYVRMSAQRAASMEQQALHELAVRHGEFGVEMFEAIIDGRTTLPDVQNAKFQALEQGQKKAADMYESFEQAMLSGSDRNRSTDIGWYVSAWEEVAELSKTKKGFVGEKFINTAEKMDRAFELLSEAAHKMATNELTRNDAQKLVRDIYQGIIFPTAKTQTVQSPYFKGFEAVSEAIKEQEIPEQEKASVLFEAMDDYARILDAGATHEQAETAAKRVLKAATTRIHPEALTMEAGKTYVQTPLGPRLLKGFSQNGSPVLGLEKSDIDKIQGGF